MQKVGRYEIKGRLGKGAMALVLRAFDPRFKREVALKVLHRRFARDPIIRQRFLREAQAIARLEHPAIVPVHDVGQDGELVYLAMRLMEGGTLGDRIAKGVLALEEIVPVIDRIGSALDYAHEQGFIHRDVKPDNILFDQFGQPYLVDFGIVRSSESQGTLTIDSLLGTPAYMSPEQVNGEHKLDGRSDLYSLGVVLFEMLTGDVPYRGDTVMQTAMKHVLADIPRHASLAKGWQPVVNRILAKQPDARYQTGAELATAVKAVGAGRRSRRFSPIALAVAGIGLIAIIVLIGYLVFNTQSQEANLNTTRTAVALAQAENATNLQATQEAFVLTAAAGEGDLSEELRLTQIALDAAFAQLTQQAIAAEATQVEEVLEDSELDCTDSANYQFTLGEAILEPPIGTTLVEGDDDPTVKVRWTVVNATDGCPLTNLEVKSLADNPLPRMELTDSTGNFVGSLLPGAEAQLTLFFDEPPSDPFSEQWTIVVDGGADDLLILAEAPTLALAVDEWVEVVTATATNTPRPSRTPQQTATRATAATRPPATATPNWNATLTAEATDTPRPSNTPNWSQTQTAEAPTPSNTPNWGATQTREALNATQTAQAVPPTQPPTPTQPPLTSTPTPTPPSCPDMDNDGICDDDDDDRDGDGFPNNSDFCADEAGVAPCGCPDPASCPGGGQATETPRPPTNTPPIPTNTPPPPTNTPYPLNYAYFAFEEDAVCVSK